MAMLNGLWAGRGTIMVHAKDHEWLSFLPSRYTGQERDAETEVHPGQNDGLDYFGARHYSSALGRFISPDPAGPWTADAADPQSWNFYAYARNNPLINIDPDGFDCVYLNNAGTGIDVDADGNPTGIDRNSNAGECGSNGGYWVDGMFTSGTVYSNSNDVYLHGYDSNTRQLTDSYTNVVTANGSNSINTGVFSGPNIFAYIPTQSLPTDVLIRMIHSLNRSGQSDKLVGCIVAQESKGKPGATSSTSTARGLMQLLAGRNGAGDVAQHSTTGLAFRHGDAGDFGGMSGGQIYSQAYDPALNIAAGSALLKAKIGYHNGDVRAGLDEFGTGSPYGQNRMTCASKP